MKEQALPAPVQRQPRCFIWCEFEDLGKVTVQSLTDEIEVHEVDAIVQLVIHLVDRRRADTRLSCEVSLR